MPKDSTVRFLCLEELVPRPPDSDFRAADQISVLLHALQPVNDYEVYIDEDDYEDPHWRTPSAAFNPHACAFIPQNLVGAGLDKQVRSDLSSSEVLVNTIENVEDPPDKNAFDEHAIDEPITTENVEDQLDKNAFHVHAINKPKSTNDDFFSNLPSSSCSQTPSPCVASGFRFRYADLVAQLTNINFKT